MATKKNDISFEEAMKELEDSVFKLESSGLTLDESIAEFEKSVKLIKLCEKKLSSAKQQVKILTEGADGVVTDAPFDGDKNEA